MKQTILKVRKDKKTLKNSYREIPHNGTRKEPEDLFGIEKVRDKDTKALA